MLNLAEHAPVAGNPAGCPVFDLELVSANLQGVLYLFIYSSRIMTVFSFVFVY